LINFRNLNEEEINSVITKLELLGFKKTYEKHPALVARFESKHGIIKIYRKETKNTYSLVATGSSPFERMINNIVREIKGEKVEPTRPLISKGEIIIGVDESGVKLTEPLVVASASTPGYPIVDSKALAKEGLHKYVRLAFRLGDFICLLTLSPELRKKISDRGYKTYEVVHVFSKKIKEFFEELGIKPLIFIDGNVPEGIKDINNIVYVGEGGEKKNENISAAGVLATDMRRSLEEIKKEKD